jgi:hypothetical protein
MRSDNRIDHCAEHGGAPLVTPRETLSSWPGSPPSSFVNGANLNIDMAIGDAGLVGQLDHSAPGRPTC